MNTNKPEIEGTDKVKVRKLDNIGEMRAFGELQLFSVQRILKPEYLVKDEHGHQRWFKTLKEARDGIKDIVEGRNPL